MSTVAIKQVVQFFREFLELCLSSGWPEDDTAPEEIVKALEVANHIELSVKKMKLERNCFDKFLDLLCTDQNYTYTFLQNCINDPPKFILKKIITSDADVNLMDVAFKRFHDLYCEGRLVETLSQLMVEAAAKETLLQNMSTTLPTHKLQELSNHLHLFIILGCNSQEQITETFKDCSQEMMDALVLCLAKNEITGLNINDTELVRRKIIIGFTNIMVSRDTSVKKFWELLFNVDKENLVEMCLKYKTISEMVFEALGDSYANNVVNYFSLEDTQSHYIQFTRPQLYSIFNVIFENETLKLKLILHMKTIGFDEDFMWVLQS